MLSVDDVCSERFKNFVELFEPGVHFFRDVNLKRYDGSIIGNYYIWTVGQDWDCVLTKGMDEYFYQQADDLPHRFDFNMAVKAAAHAQKYPERKSAKPIRISKSAVSGRHLWSGGILTKEARGAQFLFMSDEMYNAYKAEKFQALEWYIQADEVDCIWEPTENLRPMHNEWLARENEISLHWPTRRGPTI